VKLARRVARVTRFGGRLRQILVKIVALRFTFAARGRSWRRRNPRSA